jgi:hypothetical protein
VFYGSAHPEELFEVQCTHPTGPAGTCSVPVAVSIRKQARLIDELACPWLG